MMEESHMCVNCVRVKCGNSMSNECNFPVLLLCGQDRLIGLRKVGGYALITSIYEPTQASPLESCARVKSKMHR